MLSRCTLMVGELVALLFFEYFLAAKVFLDIGFLSQRQPPAVLKPLTLKNRFSIATEVNRELF
ncbi:hypothetical protein DXZ20_01260 [Leptolyngbyaceae cyanobacterium CCMR0081]|uniref:Uncharacterized protein n=1 Tax=Adonisia turfae CCMR0081 TaxID=2292702 RepID=A0A6M0RDH5_9CYAN|nr:hypothetical protein [Adonisia turfae CCMR0081]